MGKSLVNGPPNSVRLGQAASAEGGALVQGGRRLDNSQPTPILSIVISTRNRLDKLKRCVDAALAVTTKQDWELIIVDNDSTDGTSEYLDSINQKKCNRACVTTMSEPRRGASRARNKGWRAAKGEIVAFTDDDCYVEKDFVDSLIQVFDEDPNIGFLAGRVLLFDSSDFRMTFNESEDRVEFRPFTFIPAGAVQGANFAMRKTVLSQTGGYDERLGAGMPFAGEDQDLAAAASWSGVMGVYDPRPVVYHHHGRKTKAEVDRVFRLYSAGQAANYVKYIISRESRGAYFRAWMRSIGRDCIEFVRQGRLPRAIPAGILPRRAIRTRAVNGRRRKLAESHAGGIGFAGIATRNRGPATK